ncbi:MAG: hypothetical protein GEV28_22270 [Actinophytocola sp.]|uniref:hypothetical protein n=1 Tax=Actinophytocola sp. TaxID=1872138 RepID=UPI00132226FD|nr:hypothetical protein [Actinophytocola sp.]MPZ82967.1 hypothetical protein [Actinophytocola sp.]
MSANAPWTFGRVLSGLLAVIGLIVLCVGMFLSFISGDGDNFWGTQDVQLDSQNWTCDADGVCETNIRFGTIVDKGTNFPVTVSLLGVGLIGVAVMLRIRPQADPAPQPAVPAQPVHQQPALQQSTYQPQTQGQTQQQQPMPGYGPPNGGR